jgi:hypothetical protein
MNQHEWVVGCQRYYAENYYEPGNPEDGEWHDCHYPVPKCLGGTETVKLLKEHHAVQGVLQSEEYNIPCIWGWEANFLSGWFFERCKYWHSEKARLSNLSWQTLTAEERSQRARGSQTPEQLSERQSRLRMCFTFEERSAQAKLACENLGAEKRSARLRKGWEKRDRSAQAEVMKRINAAKRAKKDEQNNS